MLIGIIGTGAILSGCGAQNTAKSELVKPHHLTIGMEAMLPPYSYRSNGGQVKGFDVDLSRAISKQMHVKTNVKTTKWDGLIAGLGSHRFDGVIDNITRTPQRAKSFNFSKPYAYSPYMLMVNKKNSINNIHEIKGKKFMEGVGTDNQFVARKWGAHTRPATSFAEIMLAVKEGRVQGTIDSVQAWKAYAKTNSTKNLKAYPIPESTQAPAKISVLFNKKDPALQKRINQILVKLRKNGTLKKLSEKYFHTNITIKNQKILLFMSILFKIKI
ncbi:MAG: transporter substrate-binding domain-containing protein [Acetilactobacillus jinshanensis]